MALSPYLHGLRARIGHDLVQLPSVAVMIFDDGNRLLLVRAKDTGEWQTVGGAIDPDEVPADAALREAYEETGLEVELVRLIGVYGGPDFRLTYPNGDVCSYTSIMFAARPIGGQLRPDGEETSEVAWHTLEAAVALPVLAHTRLLIDEAYRGGTAALFERPRWRPGG
jgi:8-oxo-dGTP pyrophosphatase MutT (NUDIX family)